MSYCSQTDILAILPEVDLVDLTDQAGIGVVDEDVAARAIADADATVNAYLGGRYAVPLTSVPDKIRQVSADIAVYNLYARFIDGPPEIRTDRYKAAIRFLEQAADGKITLGSSLAAPATTAHGVDISCPTAVFGRENMKGW